MTKVKDIGLFLLAPFVGLAYAVTMPIVGIVMLSYVAYKASR